MDPILEKLLEKLHQQQNYCPYCGSQYTCDLGCALDGIWFKASCEHRWSGWPGAYCLDCGAEAPEGSSEE